MFTVCSIKISDFYKFFNNQNFTSFADINNCFFINLYGFKLHLNKFTLELKLQSSSLLLITPHKKNYICFFPRKIPRDSFHTSVTTYNLLIFCTIMHLLLKCHCGWATLTNLSRNDSYKRSTNLCSPEAINSIKTSLPYPWYGSGKHPRQTGRFSPRTNWN